MPNQAHCHPSPSDSPRSEPLAASLLVWHAGWARAVMNREHTRFQAGLATVEWLSVREPGKQFNAAQWVQVPLDVGEGKSSPPGAMS